MSPEDNKWYIFRIIPYNEKKVINILEIAGIEYYIPLQTVKRKWGEIEKEIQVPVFSGIGFAYVDSFDFGMLEMIQEISLLKDVDGNNKIVPVSHIEVLKNTPEEITNIL